MKTRLFVRKEYGLVDIEQWARNNGFWIVRISYTRTHARLVYWEAAA